MKPVGAARMQLKLCTGVLTETVTLLVCAHLTHMLLLHSTNIKTLTAV